MLVIHAAPAVHPKPRPLLVERECDGNKLILVVAVARHHNARIANLHLGPIALSDGVDTE